MEPPNELVALLKRTAELTDDQVEQLLDQLSDAAKAEFSRVFGEAPDHPTLKYECEVCHKRFDRVSICSGFSFFAHFPFSQIQASLESRPAQELATHRQWCRVRIS